MKRNEHRESAKLIEVWKMKEKVYNKTRHMTAEEFFKYINSTATNIISKVKTETKRLHHPR